nr:hypothetical protein MarFTME_222 [Marseillevirus futianmevirus]
MLRLISEFSSQKLSQWGTIVFRQKQGTSSTVKGVCFVE